MWKNTSAVATASTGLHPPTVRDGEGQKEGGDAIWWLERTHICMIDVFLRVGWEGGYQLITPASSPELTIVTVSINFVGGGAHRRASTRYRFGQNVEISRRPRENPYPVRQSAANAVNRCWGYLSISTELYPVLVYPCTPVRTFRSCTSCVVPMKNKTSALSRQVLQHLTRRGLRRYRAEKQSQYQTR